MQAIRLLAFHWHFTEYPLQFLNYWLLRMGCISQLMGRSSLYAAHFFCGRLINQKATNWLVSMTRRAGNACTYSMGLLFYNLLQLQDGCAFCSPINFDCIILIHWCIFQAFHNMCWLYEGGHKQEAWDLQQELQQHLQPNPLWSLQVFDVFRCLPFGPGHSEDLGVTPLHLQYQLQTMDVASRSSFDSYIAQYSCFPDLIRFSAVEDRSASKLILADRLQARENQSIRCGCTTALSH